MRLEITPTLRVAGSTPAVDPSMSALLNQLRAAIRTRHFSRRTEEAYVRWAYRYIRFHGTRHPADFGRA